jgi:hypothetical protein
VGATTSQLTKNTPTSLEQSTLVVLRDIPQGEYYTPHNQLIGATKQSPQGDKKSSIAPSHLLGGNNHQE